jgi:hypothetical protein
MSDEVQLSMSLPLDGDGFLRRECATCEREFKWLPSPDQLEEGNGESRAAATDAQPPDAYYCPYCTVTGAGVVYAVLSLTVIRMLPVALSMLGTGARRPTIAFLGWFGSRGLASIVFAAIVVEEADLPHANVIVSTTLVAVALSVLAHGVSAAPLVRRYVAWYESHPRERVPAMESVPAAEHRWRHPARPGASRNALEGSSGRALRPELPPRRRR